MTTPDIRSTIARRAIKLELSLAEVARRANVTAPQLSAFIAGKRNMRSDCLERVIGALGLSLTPSP